MSSSICMRDHWVLCQAGTRMGWWYWNDLTFPQGCTQSVTLTILLKLSRGSPATCLPDLRKPMAMCLLAKKCVVHRTKGARIVSPIYWETFRGCAFIEMIPHSRSGSREWSSWQWLCTCTLLVDPALPLGLDFPAPWRKICLLRVVWGCPWCWSLMALGPGVPLWLKVPLATSKLSFQADAWKSAMIRPKLHQCAGSWGNPFKKAKASRQRLSPCSF